MTHAVAVAVRDSSAVAEARRQAVAMAARLGFSATLKSNLGIVVTEAATNMLKHASGGQLVLRPIAQEGTTGIEILALDKGPGMRNIEDCLRDGYSTAGSPGTGLGAIHRLSGGMDIYTQPDSGSVVLFELWSDGTAGRGATPLPSADPEVQLAGIAVPAPGETACGDAWGSRQREGSTFVAVVDGLGHGPAAAQAANEAMIAFSQDKWDSTTGLLHAMHDRLRATRGAAAAVAQVDHAAQVVRYCSVGNVAACLVSSENCRHMVGMNGIVGHQMSRVHEFTYPWPAEGVLIMHSDGLSQRWNLEHYPGLLHRRPDLIAGVLFRDQQRPNDDATIVVAKEAA